MTRLSLYLVTMFLGARLPGAAAMPMPPTTVISAPAAVSAEEQRLIDLVNWERKSRGLQELRVNMMLADVAREHSREMYERDYFAHYSPTPELRTPKDRYLRALGRTPSWACIGENIFYSTVVDPDLGHRCFMQSPSHRDNILSPEFDQIGVGVYETPDGRFWVTQIFLTQIG